MFPTGKYIILAFSSPSLIKILWLLDFVAIVFWFSSLTMSFMSCFLFLKSETKAILSFFRTTVFLIEMTKKDKGNEL